MRWLGQLAAWLVALGAAAVLVTTVVVPRVAGATPYTVLTGSMAPDLPPGTLVVAKPVDPEDIGVGSVITYQVRSGEPEVVTHRVVAQGVSAEGEVRFQTRGDANDTADAEWVRPVQVKGGLWYSVPYLGHVNQLLNEEKKEMAIYALAVALLGYAGAMFVGAVRDRRRVEVPA